VIFVCGRLAEHGSANVDDPFLCYKCCSRASFAIAKIIHSIHSVEKGNSLVIVILDHLEDMCASRRCREYSRRPFRESADE
jgi:hypothetical protein